MRGTAADGHYADAPAHIFGDGKGYIRPVRVDGSQFLPEGKRRLAAALEGIEKTAARPGHVAAKAGNTALQTRVVGHEQVKGLHGGHIKSPVVQKVIQGIGRGKACKLQHSLVHSKKQGFARHP